MILLLFFAFLFFACKDKKVKGDPDYYYTCSMDPQVKEPDPGNCPICKMPLTPVRKSDIKEDELKLSDQQIQLGNIIVDSLKPKQMGQQLRFTGNLAVNQNNIQTLTSRSMGRIEKLYFKETGETIKKGEPVYEIYSEEINLSLRELKLFTEKKKTLTGNEAETEKIIESTRNKLLRYGLTSAQINAFEKAEHLPEAIPILSTESGVITSIEIKEGNYVMEGQNILQLTDYGTLWAEAQVFPDDLARITSKKEIQVSIVGIPGIVKGKITFVNPELNPSSKINVLRVEIENKNDIFKPGMQADFTVMLDEFSALSLPTNAIIFDAKGATVWIETAPNTFKSKMVHTGAEANGFTEIKNGLKSGDKVVISGAYLLNSEYIFKRGTDPMAGHDMSKM